MIAKIALFACLACLFVCEPANAEATSYDSIKNGLVLVKDQVGRIFDDLDDDDLFGLVGAVVLFFLFAPLLLPLLLLPIFLLTSLTGNNLLSGTLSQTTLANSIPTVSAAVARNVQKFRNLGIQRSMSEMNNKMKTLEDSLKKYQ